MYIQISMKQFNKNYSAKSASTIPREKKRKNVLADSSKRPLKIGKNSSKERKIQFRV